MAEDNLDSLSDDELDAELAALEAEDNLESLSDADLDSELASLSGAPAQDLGGALDIAARSAARNPGLTTSPVATLLKAAATGGVSMLEPETRQQVGEAVEAPLEMVVGAAGSVGGGLTGALAGPVGAVAGEAIGGALGAFAARDLLQDLGLRPKTDRQQEFEQVAAETGIGLVAGPATKAVGSFLRFAGSPFKGAVNRINTLLDKDTALAKALTSSPEEFQRFREGAVGSSRDTIVDVANRLRGVFNRIPRSKRGKAFEQLEDGVRKTIKATTDDMNKIYEKVGEALGDRQVSIRALGLNDIIDEIDQGFALIDDSVLSQQQKDALRRVTVKERDGLIRTVLGKEQLDLFQESQKTINRLNKKAIQQGGINNLAQKDVDKLFRAQDATAEVLEAFDNSQIPLQTALGIRRGLDNLAKLDKRAGSDLASRQVAEANFAIANRFRKNINAIVDEAGSGLSGALDNTTQYFQDLKRVEGLIRERAGLERAGGTTVSNFNPLFPSRADPSIDQLLEIGLDEPGSIATTLSRARGVSSVAGLADSLGAPLEQTGIGAVGAQRGAELFGLPQPEPEILEVSRDINSTSTEDALADLALDFGLINRLSEYDDLPQAEKDTLFVQAINTPSEVSGITFPPPPEQLQGFRSYESSTSRLLDPAERLAYEDKLAGDNLGTIERAKQVAAVRRDGTVILTEKKEKEEDKKNNPVKKKVSKKSKPDTRMIEQLNTSASIL